VTATRRVWGNPLPGLIPSAEEWSQGGWHVLFERILFYAPPLVYGLALLRWLAIGDDRKSAATLLAMTGFGICAYGLVLWRSGFDNLLRTLPSFYILLCFFLHRLWLRVVPEESGPDFHRDRMRVFKTLPQRWLILAFPLIFLFEINSHHGYYAGSIGAAFQETRPLRLNRLGAFTNPVEARWLRDIVDRIQRFSVKEDRILALPLNPIFYFLSERENAINHDWILPGMLDDAAQQNVVDQLRARPPAVVILADFPIDGREERRFSRYAPVIHRFIRDHYALYDTIGLFEVLLPRRMEEETPHTQAPPAENPADASHPPSDNTGMPQ